MNRSGRKHGAPSGGALAEDRGGRRFAASALHFGRSGALMGRSSVQWGEPMDIVPAAVGCLLIALGLMMAANQRGYVTFIVGTRAMLLLAGAIGVFGYWVLRGSH
jgi:hypothetical protein